MLKAKPISKVFDLLDPADNAIYGMDVEEAREAVARGDIETIGRIDVLESLALSRKLLLIKPVRPTARMLITVPLTIWSTIKRMESTAWSVAISAPPNTAARNPIHTLWA